MCFERLGGRQQRHGGVGWSGMAAGRWGGGFAPEDAPPPRGQGPLQLFSKVAVLLHEKCAAKAEGRPAPAGRL